MEEQEAIDWGFARRVRDIYYYWRANGFKKHSAETHERGNKSREKAKRPDLQYVEAYDDDEAWAIIVAAGIIDLDNKEPWQGDPSGKD